VGHRAHEQARRGPGDFRRANPFKSARPTLKYGIGSSYVITDGTLITGQNLASTTDTAQVLLDAIL